MGTPTQMGRPIGTAEAQDSIFGYVLLNDWSARDIQVWEYQPLGPVSCAKACRDHDQPVGRHQRGAGTLPTGKRPSVRNRSFPTCGRLRPTISTSRSRRPSHRVAAAPVQILRTNAAGPYYSAAQQLAHHTLSGCRMEAGDLLGGSRHHIGSHAGGTVGGSLLELTWNGTEPIAVGWRHADISGRRGHRHADGHVHRSLPDRPSAPASGTILPAPELREPLARQRQVARRMAPHVPDDLAGQAHGPDSRGCRPARPRARACREIARVENCPPLRSYPPRAPLPGTGVRSALRTRQRPGRGLPRFEHGFPTGPRPRACRGPPPRPPPRKAQVRRRGR